MFYRMTSWLVGDFLCGCSRPSFFVVVCSSYRKSSCMDEVMLCCIVLCYELDMNDYAKDTSAFGSF